jgi:DNA repair protein RadA/Sms
MHKHSLMQSCYCTDMNAKTKTIFRCSNCSTTYPRWQGKCTSCGAWDTLVEEKDISSGRSGSSLFSAAGRASAVKLSAVGTEHAKRFSTGIAEMDQVLGGGIVAGSMILLGGDPGVGKSTLALQVAAMADGKLLYVSGEESLHQLKIRADRLDFPNTPKKAIKDIDAIAETNIDTILGVIAETAPNIVVIDSIQTMYTDAANGVAGSVSQVSAITQQIMRVAKDRHISFIIIGHVTKEGYLAGPKTLEHMVDAVLYLEGERFASFRILRSVKNRFGTTNEVAVFEMVGSGIHPVLNPSEMFLQERDREASGNVVTAIVEGSRVLLLEIQALTSKSSFGYPKRTAAGYDQNRLQLLTAIISKRVGVDLSAHDIYVNVVGGMKISDPTADLAVALAIISSMQDFAFKDTVVIGELGLSGEIRTVPALDKRVAEAEKLGFSRAVVPSAKTTGKGNIQLLKVKSLREALQLLK